MKRRFNEGKACDAVLRYLEEREDGKREQLRFPEEEGHPSPIELTCMLNGRLFALEHTGIEPFPHHIKLHAQVSALMKPVEAHLLTTLPSSQTFDLGIPVDAAQGLKPRDIPGIRKRIIDWVETTAPTLSAQRMEGMVESLHNVSVEGIPFPLWLSHEGETLPDDTHFFVSTVVDQARIQLGRRERIHSGYTKKIQKLSAWKRTDDARTVLILENGDIYLTRPSLVAEAVRDIVQDALDRPDEIYLVTTCTSRWRVSPLTIDGVSRFEQGSSESRWAIDREVLQSLTRR